MYIYILLILFVIFIGCEMFINKEDSMEKRKRFLFMAFAAMALVMGLRNIDVGTDTSSYQYYFYQTDRISWTDCILSKGTSLKNAPIYLLWSKLVINVFGYNYQIFLFLNALIICGCMAFFIYKSSNHVVLSTCFYILGYFFCSSMNASRQYMALALMGVSFSFALEKKLVKAAVFSVLSIGVHVVLICFLPVYFFVWKRINIKILAGVCSIAVLSATVFEKFFLNGVEIFTKIFTKYEGYINSVFMQENGEGKKIYVTIFYLLFLIICFLVVVSKNNIEDRRKRYMELLMVPCMLSVVVGLMGSKIALLNRIEWIFGIYIILLIPEIIFCFEKKYRYCGAVITIAIMFIPFYIQLKSGINGVVPYHAFWNGL